jgi:hydrogenase maturation protein HypF
MAEHGLEGPVIGIAYDGTGWGEDGAIWGGEIMVADWASFRRAAHLRYVPLLGGESAIRKPYRMAASYLWTCFGDDARFEPFLETIPPAEREILRRNFEASINAPPTSSCGRLFDAVSALLGVGTLAAYEGEPAIRLEAVADPSTVSSYPFELRRQERGLVADPAPALAAILEDLRNGVPLPRIAGAFHNAVAAMTVAACVAVREETGIRDVCISGGCFQNALLAARTLEGLADAGFTAYAHHRVPPNDGGLALGQAVVAWATTQPGA